jgi:hypothetical protein
MNFYRVFSGGFGEVDGLKPSPGSAHHAKTPEKLAHKCITGTRRGV